MRLARASGGFSPAKAFRGVQYFIYCRTPTKKQESWPRLYFLFESGYVLQYVQYITAPGFLDFAVMSGLLVLVFSAGVLHCIAFLLLRPD